MIDMRLFNSSDAPTMYRWYHDPRLRAYFRGNFQFLGASPEQCARVNEMLRAHVLVALQQDNPEMRVGFTSLAETHPVIRILKLGILVDPDHQHNGCGKVMIESALDWAFHTACAHKVYCEILEQDERIITAAKLMGFQQEGTVRSSQFFDNTYHNELLFSILRAEWRG